jgi:hypothetical protein
MLPAVSIYYLFTFRRTHGRFVLCHWLISYIELDMGSRQSYCSLMGHTVFQATVFTRQKYRSMFFILTYWCDRIFILYFAVLYLHASLINLFLSLHHLVNINLSDTCHNTVFQLVVEPVDVTLSVVIYGCAAFKQTTPAVTVASRMTAIQSLLTSQKERWMFQVTVLWIYYLKMALWGWQQIGVHKVLIKWWLNNLWVHVSVFLQYFW